MTDKIKIQCPGCESFYYCATVQLGKRAKCTKCNTIFVASTSESPADEEIEIPDFNALSAAVKQDAAPTPPATKSLVQKMNEWADKASRKVHLTYLHGPWAIKANTAMTMILEDDRLVFQIGIISKREDIVAYGSITGVSIDTAERLGKLRTLGTLVLAGPLAAAFVGFGIKKKDRFLKLDFKDETGTSVAAVFGKGPACDIESLEGRILEKKRQHQQLTNTSEASANDGHSDDHADIAATIENLSRLREKGILSEEEFQTKKQELLRRL